MLRGLQIFTGHSGPVYSAVFSPDGQVRHQRRLRPARARLASRRGQSVLHSNCLPREPRPRLPSIKALESHTAAVRSICVIREGPPRILSAGHDNTVKVWDYETGVSIQTLRGHAGWIRGCAVSSDGRLAVSASHDHEAKLWNLEGYEEVRVLNARVLSGHADAITSATSPADDRQILTSSRDRTARIWSLDSGRNAPVIRRRARVPGIASDLFPRRPPLSYQRNRQHGANLGHCRGTEVRSLTGTGASGLVTLSPTSDGC